jgi:Protein of unknown function (DUF4232)
MVGSRCIIRQVRVPAVIVVVAAVITAAGCGSSGPRLETTTEGPTVAWTASLPPQMANRSPVSSRCRAADLRLPDEVRFVPNLTGGIALVTFRNVGKHACRLAGRPRVRFVHAVPPTQVQKPTATTQATFPDVAAPKSILLALEPGEVGAVTVTWNNWCDPKIPGKRRVPPSAIRFTLPAGGGSLATDYNAVAACDDPSQPSTIGVSVFQPSLVPTGSRWTNAFVQASIPDQPLRARRGGVLRYRVVLKNISPTPAQFSRCPAYAQQLAPAGKPEIYSLNCSAAHQIAHGKSLAFAMRLAVPQNAPLGHNGLFWMLDPFGRQGPELNVRVNVRR